MHLISPAVPWSNPLACSNMSPEVGPRATLLFESKIITGSLVIPENLLPPNCRYCYRREIRMNSFNFHYLYRLGVHSHPFIPIDSQLLS